MCWPTFRIAVDALPGCSSAEMRSEWMMQMKLEWRKGGLQISMAL